MLADCYFPEIKEVTLPQRASHWGTIYHVCACSRQCRLANL